MKKLLNTFMAAFVYAVTVFSYMYIIYTIIGCFIDLSDHIGDRFKKMCIYAVDVVDSFRHKIISTLVEE